MQITDDKKVRSYIVNTIRDQFDLQKICKIVFKAIEMYPTSSNKELLETLTKVVNKYYSEEDRLNQNIRIKALRMVDNVIGGLTVGVNYVQFGAFSQHSKRYFFVTEEKKICKGTIVPLTQNYHQSGCMTLPKLCRVPSETTFYRGDRVGLLDFTREDEMTRLWHGMDDYNVVILGVGDGVVPYWGRYLLGVRSITVCDTEEYKLDHLESFIHEFPDLEYKFHFLNQSPDHLDLDFVPDVIIYNYCPTDFKLDNYLEYLQVCKNYTNSICRCSNDNYIRFRIADAFRSMIYNELMGTTKPYDKEFNDYFSSIVISNIEQAQLLLCNVESWLIPTLLRKSLGYDI